MPVSILVPLLYSPMCAEAVWCDDQKQVIYSQLMCWPSIILWRQWPSLLLTIVRYCMYTNQAEKFYVPSGVPGRRKEAYSLSLLVPVCMCVIGEVEEEEGRKAEGKGEMTT